MTTNHHTAISTGAAANASTFNNPLGQLDAQITTNAAAIAANALLAAATTAEVVAARAAYPNLDARLTDLILSGGNVATKANGVSNAAQKVLTVDSTTGFIVGAYVTYLLNGTDLEGNTIASIQAGVSLTLGTNIGTGGVLDDTYVSMISTSEYQAAQAIPHAGTLLLSDTMEYVNADVYHAEAYGAVGDGSTDDTAAFAALLAAVKARSGTPRKGAVVKLTPGKTYKITASLDMTSMEDVEIDGVSTLTTIVFAPASGSKVLFDCLGSARLVFRNLTMWGDSTAIPKVAISLGRSTETGGEDAGMNQIDNCHFKGYWSIAAIYNIASELMRASNFWMLVNGPATALWGVYCSGYDEHSVGSDYVTRSSTHTMSGVFLNNYNIGCAYGVAPAPQTWVPLGFGAQTAGITLLNGYSYTYHDASHIILEGSSYGINLIDVGFEGYHDKSIWFKKYAGSGGFPAGGDRDVHRNISINGFGAVGYTAQGFYQDADTIIYGLFMRSCVGSTPASASNISLLGTVWYADIGQWFTSDGGTVVLNEFFQSSMLLSNHTLTVTGSDSGSEFIRFPGSVMERQLQNLRVGSTNQAGTGLIKRMLRATATWSPGEIAASAAAHKAITVTGVAVDGTWFCQASYAGIGSDVNWVLSAHVSGANTVTTSLFNATTGAITPPSAALSVIAWEIGA